MQLEDYFQFERLPTKFGEAETIRIKGHRISIEHVIQLFQEGMEPGQIQQEYPSLSLEEIYATITYYLHNKAAVDDYIERGEKIADAFYQEHSLKEPTPGMKRLRELKGQRQAKDHE